MITIRRICLFLGLLTLGAYSFLGPVWADHPGEHPGTSPHGSTPQINTVDYIRKAVADYVKEKSGTGWFNVNDSQTAGVFSLRYVRPHPVRKIDDSHWFLCADFKGSLKARDRSKSLSNCTVDLDFYLTGSDTSWKVTDVWIHKVNGLVRPQLYACPKHPDIRTWTPGQKCPVCGTSLTKTSGVLNVEDFRKVTGGKAAECLPSDARCAGYSLPFAVRVNATHSGSDVERTVHFRYSFQVAQNPTVPGSAAMQHVVAWVPLPRDTAAQRVTSLEVHSQTPHRVVTEAQYGNRMMRFESPRGARVLADIELTVQRYRVRWSPPLGEHVATAPDDANSLALALKPNRLVVLSPRIRALAQELVSRKSDRVGQARAIYDYVLSAMCYDKSGTGWGRGDSEYACATHRGNCSDFHSLFIALCRASGIPARFVIGFPLSDAIVGRVAGYHCWAEFYLSGAGWIPVDASEAWQDPTRKDELFGGLDPNRIEFTVGRDLSVPNADSREPLNFFIYPYVEVDGQPSNAVTCQFEFRALDG